MWKQSKYISNNKYSQEVRKRTEKIDVIVNFKVTIQEIVTNY